MCFRVEDKNNPFLPEWLVGGMEWTSANPYFFLLIAIQVL